MAAPAVDVRALLARPCQPRLPIPKPSWDLHGDESGACGFHLGFGIGEFGELLLIIAYQRGEFVTTIGGDDTDTLDDQLGAHRAPNKLTVGSQPVEPLPLPAKEDEAEQVAAVRLEEERLKAFDLTASPRCCSWP